MGVCRLQSTMEFEVVIAGGGFAGAYCARALGRAFGKDEGEEKVALVAERNVLVFQPMIPEVAGSSLSPADVVNPLRQFCRGVNVLQGTIQKIDCASKTILLDGGRFTRDHKVGFKNLVLALGSVTDMRSIPGMPEYGWPMKNVSDALRLRAALINRMEEANLVEDGETQTRLLTFVVVGGGYTGVETAGQLLDFIRQAHRFYANLRELTPRVVLVHGGDELLAEIGPQLGAYARGVLVKRGVEVRLNTKVSAVTAQRVILADGSGIDANTVVTTIGNAPNPIIMDVCKQLGIDAPKGRIPTEPTMRVAGFPFLWAAGDGASVPWIDKGKLKVSPATAQFAFRQGTLLGKNVFGALRGIEPRPFQYRYMGQLATIGERAAVAEVFGFHFKGFLAWWMWRTIYLAKLPGTVRKLRVMIDWTFDLVFPRDISQILPPPEDAVRAIHLEAGETLFTQGTPCRGFFYVRQGALVLSTQGLPDRKVAAGTVIDQAELDSSNLWEASGTAAEPSDLIVFRGRLLEFLRRELRLAKRE
jgi:NADH:ubiquinone reductase (H+-translocating)